MDFSFSFLGFSFSFRGKDRERGIGNLSLHKSAAMRCMGMKHI